MGRVRFKRRMIARLATPGTPQFVPFARINSNESPVFTRANIVKRPLTGNTFLRTCSSTPLSNCPFWASSHRLFHWSPIAADEALSLSHLCDEKNCYATIVAPRSTTHYFPTATIYFHRHSSNFRWGLGQVERKSVKQLHWQKKKQTKISVIQKQWPLRAAVDISRFNFIFILIIVTKNWVKKRNICENIPMLLFQSRMQLFDSKIAEIMTHVIPVLESAILFSCSWKSVRYTAVWYGIRAVHMLNIFCMSFQRLIANYFGL